MPTTPSNNKANVQQFTSNDVIVESCESLHSGFFSTNKYTLKHRKFDGSWTTPIQREVFERGHAVAMLPYDPVNEEFVLLEQFRFPAMETSQTPWLIEVVAGIIEEDETFEDVCIREAKEEANLEVEKLTKVMSYLSSPGGTTERLYLYLGKVDATKAGGIFGLEHETEDILVHRVSEADARQWLEDGKIENAAAIILLQWFFLNKSALLEKWRI